MTSEEREEMNRLCRLIQDEKDHEKFAALIAKLLEVISRKERRMEEANRKTPER
jgi:hypothetical protein